MSSSVQGQRAFGLMSAAAKKLPFDVKKKNRVRGAADDDKMKRTLACEFFLTTKFRMDISIVWCSAHSYSAQTPPHAPPFYNIIFISVEKGGEKCVKIKTKRAYHGDSQGPTRSLIFISNLRRWTLHRLILISARILSPFSTMLIVGCLERFSATAKKSSRHKVDNRRIRKTPATNPAKNKKTIANTEYLFVRSHAPPLLPHILRRTMEILLVFNENKWYINDFPFLIRRRYYP